MPAAITASNRAILFPFEVETSAESVNESVRESRRVRTTRDSPSAPHRVDSGSSGSGSGSGSSSGVHATVCWSMAGAQSERERGREGEGEGEREREREQRQREGGKLASTQADWPRGPGMPVSLSVLSPNCSFPKRDPDARDDRCPASDHTRFHPVPRFCVKVQNIRYSRTDCQHFWPWGGPITRITGRRRRGRTAPRATRHRSYYSCSRDRADRNGLRVSLAVQVEDL